jgi:hypothetical protein
MREANMLQVEVSYEEELQDYTEFVAMIAETFNNTSISAYLSEQLKCPEEPSQPRNAYTFEENSSVKRSVHAVAVELDNRNTWRRNGFEGRKRKKKGKGKEKEEELLIPRQIAQFKDKLLSPEAKAAIAGARRNSPIEEAVEATKPPDKTTPEDRLHASQTRDGVRVERARRARSHPAGFGSLGVKALHIKVSVGSPEAMPVKGRLDSGADITLMSEEFFKTLSGLPQPREGMRMKLYALTGKAKVLGFTRFTMYCKAQDGILVSFEVEAYVVHNMRVPLLLGEDFQLSYKMGVTRYSSGHCDISVGCSG